ncbi:SDR family NAD(P)-dependent oxidoreductase [Sphingomonas sp.]|uniref:SDR family NAD(P)-dependent oxidoreductase n=1 Tax=Sphingomonas sp. TaxID=28214 RepID=UPI003F71614B
MMTLLTGRLAVVTDAASGIGRATAIRLARQGARVVLADIAAAGLAETAALICEAGGEAHCHVADCADPSQIDGLADFAAGIARLDIWCNSAGVAAACPAVDVDPSFYDRILDLNLGGSFWACTAAARRMIPQGRGFIVNISSNAADEPIAGLSLYAMSKAAVNMLTRTLAKELGPHGIRVNAVAPGFTVTPMTVASDADAQALIARNAARSPLGLVGSPDDVAAAVAYLVSDDSRFVTGQILRVNGGITMP